MKKWFLLGGIGLLFVLLAGNGFGQEYKVDEHTLLLCHFNSDSCNADYASGAKETGTYSKDKKAQLGVPGVYGSGVKLPPGVTISYQGKGNINPERGTLEFWVIPSWSMADAAERKYYFVLGILGKGYIVWRNGNKNFVFSHPDAGSVSVKIESWLEGEPHHVAVTWDKDVGIGLYLDGQKVSFKKAVWQPKQEVTDFTLGYTLQGGVIDELRISDIVRENFNLGE